MTPGVGPRSDAPLLPLAQLAVVTYLDEDRRRAPDVTDAVPFDGPADRVHTLDGEERLANRRS